MRKVYRVVDASTNEVLDGKTTGALVRACAASLGAAVDAYSCKGAWYYLAPSEVESYKQDLGVEVKHVYVEEV